MASCATEEPRSGYDPKQIESLQITFYRWLRVGLSWQIDLIIGLFTLPLINVLVALGHSKFP